MAHFAEADALVEQAARQVTGKEHAKLAPSYANAHNTLAWLLLTGPKELRDPAPPGINGNLPWRKKLCRSRGSRAGEAVRRAGRRGSIWRCLRLGSFLR
jgi:hypothetical protein